MFWGAQRVGVRLNGHQLGIPREEDMVRWTGGPGLLWGMVVFKVDIEACLDRAQTHC